MSFSSNIKQELNKANSLVNKENVKFELMGYCISGNTDVIKGKNIRFSTESDYNINRFSKLLSNLEINHEIDVNGKTFYIITKAFDIHMLDFVEIKNDEVYIKQSIYELGKDVQAEEKKKAFIRGAFLGAGSISNPENSYHLEMVLSNENNLKILRNILQEFGIQTKELLGKNRYSIYIKDGEEISKFLAFIGANSSVLKFEEIRVYREMRNNVNRLVNCETANLAKTVDAGVKQINAINKLKQTGKFNSLPDNLKELANLRLKNPESSLVELGKMLKEPIGKSGVNYRMKKILELGEEE